MITAKINTGFRLFKVEEIFFAISSELVLVETIVFLTKNTFNIPER